ncbi:MAG: SIS domain-containing protein [Candidatus Limivicinus sp.]|jgi:uncharacterized phosphosugar-binding protein
MLLDQYAEELISAIESIRTDQRGKILKAAQYVKKVLSNDGLIYVFGCGHSHILCEETFYRAGGLASVAPILYPPLMLHEGAAMSSRLERHPNLAAEVLKQYDITEKDMLFCFSTSGVNSVPIEFSQAVYERGIPVVTVLSSAYFAQESRCPNGKHLYEVCNLWIDNMAPHGDACLQPEGSPVKSTPVSTITSAYIINSILAEGAQMALAEGIDVPIYLSGNLPGGYERNLSLINVFSPRIKHL